MGMFFKIAIHVVVFSCLIFYFVFFGWSGSKSECPTSGISTASSTKITIDNFGPMLSENEIVKNLPSDAMINLILLNESVEKSYILSKNNVSLGKSESPDVVLTLPIKYLDNLTTQNFCGIVKAANANKELSVDLKLSMTRFLIKYRSVLKYRDCLGI